MSQAFTRYAIIVMVVVGFFASVYACGSATDASRGDTKLEKLAVGEMSGMDFSFQGERAPDSAFIGPDGKDISIADFRGKVVVLNLWATWCAPCEREMPSLAALQSARGNDTFEVVALSIDELSERDFVEGELEKLTGGVLVFYQTKDLEILKTLGVVGFPTTIIYAADGTEIARLRGDADWAGYQSIAFMDAVLEN